MARQILGTGIVRWPLWRNIKQFRHLGSAFSMVALMISYRSALDWFLRSEASDVVILTLEKRQKSGSGRLFAAIQPVLARSAGQRATMNSALDWLGRACRYRLVVATEAWPKVACTR
jgi:hypothetical protein